MARASMAEEFLFGRGNAHVGVIWEKFAVETLGNGTIAAPSDAWTIIRDTATFARNPAKYLPSEKLARRRRPARSLPTAFRKRARYCEGGTSIT